MTKLYCPKGHEINNFPNNNNTFFNAAMCHFCKRPYFEIDCLTEPKKEKIIDLKDFVSPLKPASLLFDDFNSVESHVNDTNAVETKVNPSDMEWVNPKRESQVAIERVIEALIKVSQSEDVNITTHSNILGALIHELEVYKLEEINKND